MGPQSFIVQTQYGYMELQILSKLELLLTFEEKAYFVNSMS